MELKELIDLSEKLEIRINAYWTYWSVAILAVGGWLFSSDPPENQQLIWVALGVIAFFLANLGVLWPVTRLAVGVQDEIRLRARTTNFSSIKLVHAFEENILPIRWQLTIVLHLAVDSAVLLVLLRK